MYSVQIGPKVTISNKYFVRVTHWIVIYPLAIIGSLVVFGGLIAVLDKTKETAPELICTPGYPCYEKFD